MNIVYFCQASESRKSMLVRLELHPPSLTAKAPWKIGGKFQTLRLPSWIFGNFSGLVQRWTQQ